ncbi:MAG TPA: hypothetical protein VIQ02_07890 [Jiangellaceae bacterium]
MPIWPGYISASWSRAGQDWQFDGGPVTDAELAELVELLGPLDPGENIDVEGWSGGDGADFLFRSARGADNSRLSYTVESENVILRVGDRPGLFWPQVVVGDRVVEVAGKPAILDQGDDSPEVTLFWQPAGGVYASVSSGADPEQLLEIAQTIEPVPADDERVVDAWFTRIP